MGFRFRKSIKVAPGVKINLGKRGASVTVGNKYARTTIGKGRRTNSVSLPGTGISYVEQTNSNKKKSKTQSNSSNMSATSNRNGNQDPNQKMSWETALKIIKWAFYAFLAFFIIMMASDSKGVYFGAAIIIVGMVLTRLKRKNIVKFKQTWIVSTFGWILTLILWVSNIEPVDNTVLTPEPKPTNEVNTLISTPEEQEKEEPKEVEIEPVAAETIEPEEVIIEEPVEEVIEEVVAEEPVAEPVAQPVTQPVVEREYFQNCTELRKVYPSGVASDHPAYQSKMDRDKDGWACER